MKSSIRLHKFVSDPEVLPDAQRTVWPVSILASGLNMDEHVFVYHIGRNDDPIPGDKFECVASVSQLMELPKIQGTTVTLVNNVPYYRSNIVTFYTRSAEEMERIWNEVVAEVELLVRNWNAAERMRGTKFALIEENITSIRDYAMNPPVRKQLVSYPAGLAVTTEVSQEIANPDATRAGWLPLSVAGPGAIIPPGGKFFYNIQRDPALLSHFPPPEPFSGHMLHKNGLLMPYGVVWAMTANTVWWLDYRPETLPEYARVAGQSADGNAPWPTSYVDPLNPGEVPNLITLTLFL